MDFSDIADALSVKVRTLDLNYTSIGQLVTVVTNKGTFWLSRLLMTDLHGQDQSVTRIAIWGTDFAAGDPMDNNCTRLLETGMTFTAFNGSDETTGTIEHILLSSSEVS